MNAVILDEKELLMLYALDRGNYQISCIFTMDPEYSIKLQNTDKG